VVTGQPDQGVQIRPMLAPFPAPGATIAAAYRELRKAATGTDAERKALGDPGRLARPWDPATCSRPELRQQLWDWLDKVVTWINSDYVWDVSGVIPACWPKHPHLVHEIAILADRRRVAGISLASDALEEWHRYTLPAFLERLRSRIRDHCENGHQPWPANGRHARHTGPDAAAERGRTFQADLAATSPRAAIPARPVNRLVVVDDRSKVDPATGELHE
jgi:hypothetical protein